MIDHDRARFLAAGEPGGFLTPDERTELELHLRSCPACRVEAAAIARDQAELAMLTPVPVAPRVHAAVAAAAAPRRTSIVRWPLLAAALLVVAIAAFAGLGVGGGLTEPEPASSAPATSPAPGEAVATPGPGSPDPGSPGPEPLSFRAAPTVDVGASPTNLDTGDVDGDGELDLVLGGATAADEIVILRGDGRGNFGERVAIASPGMRVNRVIDLDEDGAIDVVGVDTARDAIVVLYGERDGAFGQPVRLPVGDAPHEVIAIDLDGDGRLDLLTPDTDSEDLSILRGLGDRGFDPVAVVPAVPGPWLVAPGDFDGDGRLDVAVGARTTGLAVHFGGGDGSLGDPAMIEGAFAPRDLSGRDVDGDGDDDLVLTNRGQDTVTVLTSTAPGPTWTRRILVAPHPDPDGPSDIELADLNDDGAIDLIVLHAAAEEIVIWLGDGRGGFAEPQTFGVGDGPRAVEVGDVNGDGRLDLVATNQGEGSISVLLAD